MSGSSSGEGPGTNAAEAEFQRYKARLAGAPPMMVPMVMGAGWAVPPSLAQFGAWGPPATAANAGSIGERLGLTVRLGIDFLNGLLASGAGTLGNAAAMLPEARGGGWAECGCQGNCGCGFDCCREFGCGCCHSGLSGCCCH